MARHKDSRPLFEIELESIGDSFFRSRQDIVAVQDAKVGRRSPILGGILKD